MKKILCFTLAIVLLLSGLISVSGVTISEIDPNNKYKYEEIVISKAFSEGELEDSWFEIHYYSEGYEYYSPNNSATVDEAIPDYVVINLAGGFMTDMPIAHVYEDYVLHQSSGEYPFAFGVGVFVPKTEEIFSLTAAYDMGIEGIEKVFTEGGIGRLIGDMDKDRVLTIKDATYIQKIIAGLEGFTEPTIYAAEFDDTLPISISDFNRDRVRNIKDATAIQKHIAGLAY